MNNLHRNLALVALAGLGLLALAACNWPNMNDDEPPSDFAQKAIERHHANGDMNDYQYQQSERQFTPPDPNAQKPADAAGTAAPAGTSATTN